MIKLNIGSHEKLIGDDYINIDGLKLENVHLVTDLNNVPFQFDKNGKVVDLSWIKNDGLLELIPKSNSVDEIQMIEVLEHISFRNTYKVLCELNRILKPGGKLHIQVPDCGRAMEYYAKNQVCNCVPHKPINSEASANQKCTYCSGEGKIHPDRWLFSFTGAQKHQYDAHLAIFTEAILEDKLVKAGFEKFEIKSTMHGWKLDVVAYK